MRQLGPKRLHWGHWIIISIVTIVIIVLAVITIWILIRQGFAQVATTLTIISILVAIVIGLPSLMMGFLQWYSSTHSDTSKYRDIQSEPIPPALPSAEPERPHPSGDLPPISNVPYQRNPLFTGRDNILTQLHDTFNASEEGALTRRQAISGLGGVGKTQITVEYAYRYRNDYQVILWARADSPETLISDFVTIASLLNLTEKDVEDQKIVVNAVTRWLNENSGWLLILDNLENLETQKQAFATAGLPMISVDTKKKELIGNFKNAGQAWCQHPEEVNVHDFPFEALARAVPYGIYDVSKKRGSVYVGLSADTPEFAVAAIARWWEEEGRKNYPQAKQLLILADAGGSNGCRPRSFKLHLQEQVSDRYGLTVNVCHYPTGCSKWNPIEHRLFSHIGLNWAGKPLRTLETMLNLLRGTTTTTGLTVRAALLEGTFEKGQTVSEDQMKQLNIEHASTSCRCAFFFLSRASYAEVIF